MSFQSRLCPNCGSALKTSGKGWVYCPNKYTPKQCPYKATAAKAKVTGPAAVDIRPLARPSGEQQTVMARAAETLAHLLVVAYAGTGKSTILVQLVRIFAVVKGLSVLCLSFAKRDKENLIPKVGPHAKVMTSNGAGLSILSAFARRQGRRLNVNDDLTFQILETRLKADGVIRWDAQEGREKWDIGGNALSAIRTLAEKARIVLPLAANDPALPAEPTDAQWQELADRFDCEVSTEEWPIVHGYAVYLFRELASLKNMLVYGVDFAGQVFLPVYHNLRPDTTYDRVLVDEAQDQSFVNRMIVRMFVRPGGSIVAVGDRHQAIYSWRGADFAALDEMAAMMTRHGGQPERLPLTLNRRSGRNIIAEAQKIVPAIQPLPDGEWLRLADEAKDPVRAAQCREIAETGGTVREVAEDAAFLDELKARRRGLVLCRANAPIVSACLRLLAARIPAALARSNIVGELLGMIDRSAPDGDPTPVTDVLTKVREWLADRLAKLATRHNGAAKAQVAQDKVACLEALAEEETVRTAGDLKKKIDTLFPVGVTPDPAKMVLFSTVHGAKGSEADTVYLYSPEASKVCLWDMVWDDEADRDNTLYVALTRPERELIYAGQKPTLAPMAVAVDAEEAELAVA